MFLFVSIFAFEKKCNNNTSRAVMRIKEANIHNHLLQHLPQSKIYMCLLNNEKKETLCLSYLCLF